MKLFLVTFQVFLDLATLRRPFAAVTSFDPPSYLSAKPSVQDGFLSTEKPSDAFFQPDLGQQASAGFQSCSPCVSRKEPSAMVKVRRPSAVKIFGSFK